MTSDDVIQGHSIDLLKALHILTRDGKINQDSRRKLKQVTHLFRFIEPMLKELAQSHPAFRIVDMGAGKSYLGFILMDLFLRDHAPEACVIGIDTRQDLVDRSEALAKAMNLKGMAFLNLSAGDALISPSLPSHVDMVTALHACNTATDDAIRFGLQKHARYLVLVPCCQAEVAANLRRLKSQHKQDPLSEIWRHPLHTREFGSQLTNALRCLQLEAHGYQVTVTELVGWEHSMKNELILAERKGPPQKRSALRLLEILDRLGLDALRERFFVPAQFTSGAAPSSTGAPS